MSPALQAYFLPAELPGKPLAYMHTYTSQVAIVPGNLSANSSDARDVGSIPGLGSSAGVGNGNCVQYSCLENSMGRGARWATVYGVQKIIHDRAHTHTYSSCSFLLWFIIGY